MYYALNLDSDSEVRILILKEDESLTKDDTPNPLLAIDNWAIDMGIDDLSEQHDHYLYGVPNPDKPEPKEKESHAKPQRREDYAKQI